MVGKKMKNLTVLLIILSISSIIYANTKDSTIVGPGVVHYHEFRSEGPWHFNVLKVDLTNEWISIETVKSNDRLTGFERTSSMASRNDNDGHRVVGATNGDFYDGSGTPIGTQVINGEILKSINDWQNIGFNFENNTMIENVNFSGKVMKNSTDFNFTGINQTRTSNSLILYNYFWGNSTQTNNSGSEILVNPLSGWFVNDTLNCVVENFNSGQGNMSIPPNKAVISGNGTAEQFLINNIQQGDTIKVILNLLPGLEKLTQLIGGNQRLVTNGIAVGTAGDRHPRTSIGFNSDSTMLYLFTIDGRQPGFSAGMTTLELSNYMLEWGIYQGINLDGGGSSTMFVRGEIKNSPSDAGGERSVSNAIMVVSSAPDSDLALLRISPNEVFVTSGSTILFEVEGFDEFYNYVSLNQSSIIWSCDPQIGIISSTGLFTAADDTVTGYVYASVGAIIDSALVRMTQLESISLAPNPVILEVGEFQQMVPEARDNYNNIVDISISDYSWSVTGNVGTINSSGFFTATTSGEGQVIAEYNGIQGTSPVTVGIPTAVIIDDFSNTSNFSISGVNVNLSGCSLETDSTQFISSPSSAKLTYDLTTGGTSALYMNCSIPISGTPDKIGINVYGDNKQHWLRGEFEDADNEKFLINFTEAAPGINWIAEWKYLEKSFDDAQQSWVNPTAVLTFPITWKRIYLVETDDSKKDHGIIYLDDFQVDFILSDIEEHNPIPTEFKLDQNYPNPFNPSTIIKYSIPERAFVVLKIFDLLGKEVMTLVNEEKDAGNYKIEFNATSTLINRSGSLSTGIYFYRLSAAKNFISKKMLFLK
jgi:exopolysaccharide biosynthesis protein